MEKTENRVLLKPDKNCFMNYISLPLKHHDIQTYTGLGDKIMWSGSGSGCFP
jgi:hypothetical protein